MRRIAEKRDAAKAPGGQRILVDHRILEHELRGAQEGRHVEPVEAPGLGVLDEAFDARGAVPVPPLVLRRLDLPKPVHELPALAIHLVPDRVVHEFPGRKPACAQHGGARKNRLPARHPAPHVDAAIARLGLVRIELPAHDGMDAVATHRDLSLHRSAIAELQPDTVLVLFKPQAMPAELQPFGAETLFDRLEQNGLKIAAMNGKLRPGIAGAPTERLAIDELTEPVEERGLLRLHRDLGKRTLEAELAEHLHRVRQEVDAHAYRFDLGRRLEDAARDAAALERERKREPADAGADDEDVIHAKRLASLAATRDPCGGRS